MQVHSCVIPGRDSVFRFPFCGRCALLGSIFHTLDPQKFWGIIFVDLLSAFRWIWPFWATICSSPCLPPTPGLQGWIQQFNPRGPDLKIATWRPDTNFCWTCSIPKHNICFLGSGTTTTLETICGCFQNHMIGCGRWSVGLGTFPKTDVAKSHTMSGLCGPPASSKAKPQPPPTPVPPPNPRPYEAEVWNSSQVEGSKAKTE